VVADAWGPGAGWLVAHAAAMVGADDSRRGFEPERHPLVHQLDRRLRGVRLPRTARVLDALVPAILEQKVIGLQARRSWRAIVARFGAPAPGPRPDLRLSPPAERLATLPSYVLHPLGIERKRADAIRRAAAHAARLEAAALDPRLLDARLRTIRGIGPWTSAEVRIVAAGDPDAVSVGDYHLPHLVTWALAGEPRGDDARMLELLQPFAGHRGRVVRLLELAAPRPPRYGPRLALVSFADK
jgi:3-methyladenine DNA glycosylase/8-oxoguanine DNA glycosylase